MATSSILKRSIWRLRKEGLRLTTYSATFSVSPLLSVAPHQSQCQSKSQRLYFSALPTQSDNDAATPPTPPLVLPPSSAAIVSKEDETHEETKRIRLSEVRNDYNSLLPECFLLWQELSRRTSCYYFRY